MQSVKLEVKLDLKAEVRENNHDFSQKVHPVQVELGETATGQVVPGSRPWSAPQYETPSNTKNLKYSVFKTTMRASTILFLYFLVPALIIQKAEIHEGNSVTGEKESEWGFGEALYYCFITLTTIGYGDYMTEGSALNSSIARNLYFVYIEIWKIFGLVCVSLVMGRLSDKIEEYIEERSGIRDSGSKLENENENPEK